MKGFLFAFTIFAVSAAVYTTVPDTHSNNSYEGLCVVEFNASFNAQNSVPWIDKLSDCDSRRVDIISEPDKQKEHKIVVVPTIIIFNEGVEVKRYQANILMEIEVDKQTVQQDIDEIIMSDF